VRVIACLQIFRIMGAPVRSFYLDAISFRLTQFIEDVHKLANKVAPPPRPANRLLAGWSLLTQDICRGEVRRSRH
jgi:hypothetical protein